ncbi:unnamed protein product [Rotaria sp. Silwood2]|nr:unnamed protein product [Rotaria sp. Silwood2]CAF4294005.1 unnamed protein product [Rotaria sp. Silwood2]
MTTTVLETPVIDHIITSEKYRLETFSSLLNFSLTTCHQLALAGFIYCETRCLCPQCGVIIDLTSLDDNTTYASNYFRKLHREKVFCLGKHCRFLLCETGTNIDDLRSQLVSQQGEKSQWDDAEQPDFNDYNIRLRTFDSWPHLQQAENSFVTPVLLAKNGFYFSDLGPNDGVTCFYCGNTLMDWSATIHDANKIIVQLEHARFFPCRFIRYLAGQKFVANAEYFHAVSDQERRSRNPIPLKSVIVSNKPQSIDECLLTYEKWPSDAPISAKNLAQTGFYYSGDQLKVKCYMCGLEIDDWHNGMTAFGTHKRRQSNCAIIQAMLSTTTGDFRCVNETWRLQTLEDLSFETNCDQRLCRELAACGFYRFKNTKDIRCAYCGVLIEPKTNSTIMSQHRVLAKRLKKSSTIDCLMVRAKCSTNIAIPDRECFPEYPQYQSISDRIKTFESYSKRYKVFDSFIRERAEVGFFLDTIKRMRCFQCGNSLLIHDKELHNKYSQYDIRKLHAHFYPTCEWVKEIIGSKYIAQALFDSTKSNDNDLTPDIERNMSDYFDDSDSDEDILETINSPFQVHYIDNTSPIQLPSPSSCVDIFPHDSQDQRTSFILNSMNPFQQLALQSKSSSVDPHVSFAYELNRLDSFKRQNRDTFAQVKIEELAYAGFYLNTEGTHVKCPWCIVELTEQKFENIMRQ